MDAAAALKLARARSGLTQRCLGERAATSHPTIAAYEGGTKVPRLDTLDRILRAAGFSAELVLALRADGDDQSRYRKGEQLREALELAAEFPARRRARHLPAPPVPLRPSPDVAP